MTTLFFQRAAFLAIVACVSRLTLGAEIVVSADTRASTQTLQAAVELVRAELTAQKASGRRETIFITIAPGHYRLSQPITLNAADSGTEAAPIVFRAAKAGSVRISGAQPLTPQRGLSDPAIRSGMRAATVPLVWEASLPSGFKQAGDPRRPPGPIAYVVAANDRQLRLSRWPKDKYIEVSAAAKVGDAWEFGVADQTPATWAGERNLWGHGYWAYDWRDDHAPVLMSQSAPGKQFRFREAPPLYGVKAGARMYFENVLGELALPGEMFVDSAAGKIYFVPPAGAAQPPQLEVSSVENLLALNGASFVRFENLSFEMSTQTAISVKGGQAVALSNCTVSRTGDTAVVLEGQAHSVTKCKIYDSSSGAIRLSGGDRQTLRPGNLTATDNIIYRIGERVNTFAPAIAITGVGNTAARNEIHDLPNIAIHFSGNDHTIQANLISSICRESDDAGAIYTGRDWTARGTVIADNIIFNSPGMATKQCIGVYLDDQASGTAVLRNVFHSIPLGVVVGGGRDVEISDNLCVSVRRCVNIDSRGELKPAYSNELRSALAKVPYDRPPYTKYPHLKDVLVDSPDSPRRIAVTNNASIGTEQFIAADKAARSAIIESATSTLSLSEATGIEPQIANLLQGGQLPAIQEKVRTLREAIRKRSPK